MSKRLKWVAVLATVTMYVVLAAGSLVTNSGSAQGCGASWPLCNGKWMPFPLPDIHTLIEFSHRAITGAASFLVLALAIWAWVALRGRAVKLLAVLSVVFLLLQAALGAMAVIWPQPKAVLAAHFGISLISFASVLLLAVLVFQAGRPAAAPTGAPARVRSWVWTVALIAYGVVYLGAYVRHIGASAACQGWPLCNGELVPPLVGAVGASFVHRLAALLLLIITIRLVVLVQKDAPARPDLVRASYLTLALLLAQVFSGALLVTGHYALGTQMLHSAIVSAFFGALSYLCLQVTPGAPVRSARAVTA